MAQIAEMVRARDGVRMPKQCARGTIAIGLRQCSGFVIEVGYQECHTSNAWCTYIESELLSSVLMVARSDVLNALDVTRFGRMSSRVSSTMSSNMFFKCLLHEASRHGRFRTFPTPRTCPLRPSAPPKSSSTRSSASPHFPTSNGSVPESVA